MAPSRAPLDERIGQARAHLQPDWCPEREDGALRGVYKRRERQRALRIAGGLAVCALALLALREVRIQRRAPGAAAPLAAQGAAPPAPGPRAAGQEAPTPAHHGVERGGPALRLADGSVAEPLGGAVLAAREERPGRPVLQLRGGGARLRAAPGQVRVFRVEVAGFAIEILGTEFLVEEIAAGARVVALDEGVRVLVSGQAVELGPGEDRTFQRPATLRQRTWRALAQDGQFERAYGAFKQGGSRGEPEEIDQPGDLLLLADVARLSRHPREAVAPLRRLLARHGEDPRAPLAAFTLARVLLDDLGRPQEAAAAFLRAQALDPAGPMAEDALAREVEAWSRAGDLARARERAETYLRRHPEGRRARSVRRFGGLD